MSAVLWSGWAVAAGSLVAMFVLAARLRLCRELVACASHELRGPLTAAQIALGCAGGDESLAAVDEQLRRTRLALDDLLAAPSGSRAPDRREVVSLSEVSSRVIRSWAPVAAARGRDLQVRSGSSHLRLVADPTRLAQAAGNLVANALEHGDGPIELRTRAQAGRARLEVHDAGPGLPAPVADLVSRPRAGRGARGRGLAIAASIAERHGGQLVAAPSTGGAALAIELPAFEGVEPLSTAPTSTTSPPSTTGPSGSSDITGSGSAGGPS